MYAEPVTLKGRRVRLEPMSPEHLEALTIAGTHEELWRWTVAKADNPAAMKVYVDAALADAASGIALPFVTFDVASGSLIGSTRFGNIDHANRKVEIGWTWITPGFQRSYVNSETKYLMLSHAFEVWDCNRVELKTDLLNEKSREAMLRIGATEEGTLRQNMLCYGGRFRDTIYYSVLRSEWPDVRSRLELFMAR